MRKKLNLYNLKLEITVKIINAEEINNKEAIANPICLDYFKNLKELK